MADQPDWIQPATFIYAKLYDGTTNGAGASIPCDQYASVTIRIYNIDNTTPLSVCYQFVDPATGFIVDSGLLSCDAVTANPGWPSWTLPVVAGTLKLFAFSGDPRALVVATNNRINKRLNSDFSPVRTFAGVVPTSSPINTRVQLVGQDGSFLNSVPQLDLSHYNGQVLYDVFSGPVGITGNLEFGYLDVFQARTRVIHFQNPSSTTQRVMAGHPYAFTSWWFNTTVVSPAQPITVTITLVPATPAQ